MSIWPFLSFPPRPSQTHSGQVSWILFTTMALSLALVMTPFLWRFLTFPFPEATNVQASSFPIWGWYGLASLSVAWTAAWTRLPELAAIQLHTFTPLWLSYIVVANALTMGRTKRCLMVNQPKIFFSLFPISAVFWWIFEYLNRFVENWYYLPTLDVDAFTYAFWGSLSFSIVLPAIYGTYEFLMSCHRITRPFKNWWKIRIQNERTVGWVFLCAAGLGLVGIGIWPKTLYPLLWLSPLLMLLAVQIFQGHDSILSRLRHGDWRPVIIPALSGLICGGFWELWNSQSLAHWEYTIPYLHAFQVFEMPVLGYAGYLPFGVQCLICIHLLFSTVEREMARDDSNDRIEEPIDLRVGWKTWCCHTKNVS
ncbi:hypothetical protein [Candidatus Nitrospira salsa]